MAHSNGHADHGTRGRGLSPVLSWDRAAVPIVDKVYTKAQDSGQEAHNENGAGSLPAEWARVSRLALKHLDRCVALEPKVLHGDDTDAIHDLRVATRRLQQVLDLLFPKPHAGEIRKLYRGIKRCRRSLSEIRNYDVLLERVEEALARKRTARREAWETINEYLKGVRSLRLEKSLRKLAKANLSSIYVRLKEHLPTERACLSPIGISNHPATGGNLTAEEFYGRIGKSLKGLWTTLEEEIEQSRHEPDPAVLHRTRIAVKRVRYLIEVIHDFEVPGSKEVLIWLRGLQTQLGNWHDLVVFEEAVIGMIADPAFLRDHLETALQVERLIIGNRAQKTKLEKKYFEMTRKQTGFFKTREWVQRVVDSPSAAFAGSA